MRMQIRIAALFPMLAAAGVALGTDARIELVALPGTVRVRQEGIVPGAETVEIEAARNEYVSFQVVLTALGGNVTTCMAEVSELRSEAGAVIAPESVVLFREVFIPVRHSAPRATCPPGFIPDALVPFTNPYTGKPIGQPRWSGREIEGGLFGAGGFDVWEGRHQPLWVDVHVPTETPAGVYTGTFKAWTAEIAPVEMIVRLTVWDFALPDGPTHENHFGGFERVASYLGIDASGEVFSSIEDRYIAMMAEHRVNPPLPRRLSPEIAEDGTALFDEALDTAISDFVARYHVTNIQVPRAPFGDVLGTNRHKAMQFYRSWYAYLEGKGWTDGAYLYMLDEPNSVEEYETVRKLGALVAEAAPSLRRLVVEQPYPHKAEWGSLDEAIDIWCPLFGFVHEPSVQRVQANGDAVWSYTALVQRAPAYHPEYQAVKEDDPPYWQLDFPLVSYRIATWLNRRYGITGLLYWSTCYWGAPKRNPWLDPGFRVRWNNDGALFYPGQDAGIEGPVASMRLKNLRDGMEDYEYFTLLDARGGKEIVDAIMREAVPTWGAWNQDPWGLLDLRRRVAEAIVARN